MKKSFAKLRRRHCCWCYHEKEKQQQK